MNQLWESQMIGQRVRVKGAIHNIRHMGTIAFIILRKRDGLLQTVYEQGSCSQELKEMREGDIIEVTGILDQSEKAPQGKEVRLEKITILSRASETLPLIISRWKMNTSLEAKLNYRAVSLRNIRERAKFKIQEGIVSGFRDFLGTQGFTEIRTPKIGARGAEGGSNIFKLDYFHKPAVLAQSPQLYKQMMVGVFDRVFETGPVFRAEKHSTKRHLNEYTSLDLEMGYIDSFEEIMRMEIRIIQYIMKRLQTQYAQSLSILDVELPDTDRIPVIRFDQVKEQVAERYQRRIKNPYDLEPEEEELIGRYAKEEYGSDFIFITHYPSKKRPFYAMDDPADPRFTLSFDLLFRGLEITTGGQRIHDYRELIEKMGTRQMSEEGLKHYLEAFKYGMPPHGGLGIGLERFTMQLLKAENVREATLFPRDLNRLEP